MIDVGRCIRILSPLLTVLTGSKCERSDKIRKRFSIKFLAHLIPPPDAGMPTRRLNTHFSQKAPALPKRKAGNPYANIRQVLVIAIMVMMVAAMIVIVVIVVITIMVVAVIICRSGRRRDRAEQQS
jgi:hypothetical protein